MGDEVDSDPAVRTRLAPLREHGLVVDLLEPGVALDLFQDLRQRFFEPAFEAAHTLDAGDESRDEIITWLRGLPISPELRVIVCWPHYRAAVRLRFGDVARHYDDLWYPSADDVWITDERTSWLLQLDHEERLAFWSRPLLRSV